MPNHIFSVPCLRTIQDKDTKLYSLIDIVESAYVVSGDQLSIPPFKLFSKWRKSCSEDEVDSFELKISIIGHSIKKKRTIDSFPVQIPEKASGVTLILGFGSIEVAAIGLWKIIIEWKSIEKGRWKQVAELPIYLKQKSKIKQEL